MTRSVVGRVALVTGLVLLLAACAAGVNDVVDGPDARSAGFWLGLWHGAISPVTFPDLTVPGRGAQQRQLV